MATPTYTLIDSTTLASIAASVTFSGISATGKGDLVLVSEIFDDASNPSPLGFLTLNGDSTSSYSYVYMQGTGSAASSISIASRAYLEVTKFSPTNNSTLVITQISDFSATDKHKSVLSRSGNFASGVMAFAGRWANTSAITSLTMDAWDNRRFAVGSTFHLFQIVSE